MLHDIFVARLSQVLYKQQCLIVFVDPNQKFRCVVLALSLRRNLQQINFTIYSNFLQQLIV